MRRHPKHPILRKAGLAALGVFLLIIGALLAVISPLGRDLAVPVLLKAVAGDGTAKVEKVSGAWPGTLVLDKISLADAEGPWLAVDHVTLQWRPLALLAGRLAVTRLDIDAPVLLRQPAPSAAPEKSGGGGFTAPPIAIALDALRITRGHIAGEAPMDFDGAGALAWTRKLLAIDLALTRHGGPDEHVTLAARLDQRRHHVALDIDARGVADGLFAKLAGVPGLPGFALTGAGSGPAGAWQFKAAGSADAYGALALTGRLAWTDRLALDIEGEMKPGGALPDSLRAALGGAPRLKAHLDQAKGAESGRLAVTGDAIEILVEGGAGAPGLLGARVVRGNIHIKTTKPISLGAANRTLRPALIDATLTGSADYPALAVTFALEGLNAGHYSLSRLDGTLALKTVAEAFGTHLAVEGRGVIGDVAARGSTVIGNAAWSLAAIRDRRGAIGAAHLTLNSAALGLDATGGFNPANGNAALDAGVTSADLSAISPLARVRLAGEAALRLSYRRDNSGADAAVTLKGKITHCATAGEALQPFVGEALLVDAALTQHPDGALTLEKSTLTGDHWSASLAGRVAPALDIPITLSTDLSALGALAGLSASGRTEGRLHALGTLDDPRLALDLTSPEARIEGRMIGALNIGFTPDAKAPLPNGRLVLKAKGPLGGMDLALAVAEDPSGALILDSLSGAAYGAKLKGAIRQQGEGWAGRLDAAIADLNAIDSLAANAPRRMAGRGTASVTLGPGTDLAASLALRDVMSGSRDLSAGKLTLDAGRKNGALRLVLDGQDMRLPGLTQPIEARRIRLAANGPAASVGWSLAAEGFTGPGGSLNGKGTVAAKDAATLLALDTLDGTLWGAPVALEAPTRLNLRADGMALDPLALKIGMGRVQLSYAARGKGRQADLVVSALPIPFAGRVLAADWPQGRIAGRAGLDTLAARPSGFVDLDFSNALFSRPGKAVAEPLSGQLRARWDGRSLALQGHADRMTSTAAQPLSIDARLPLIRRPDGTIDMDPRGLLEGEIHWAGRLGTLWGLLPYDLHRLDGDAVMNGRAAGRWGAPRLQGALGVTNGAYESLTTGTRLSGITLALDAGLGGGEAKIEGMDGRGGRFSGQGHVNFGETSTVEATVTLSDLRVVGLDRLTAEASGPLRLSGKTAAPLLSGALHVDHVDATIPDRLPPSVPSLPVSFVGETDLGEPEAPSQGGSGQALGLALDVDIPGQAFLRGRGLTSEWKGRAAVKGSTRSPLVGGQIELVKGTIAFAGKNFDLTRGRANFDGSAKVDPLLDIASTQTVQGNSISLAVSGPASAPRLDITSSPDLPKDQAMALFLFGKPAQSLTTLEILDVARSVASLTGTGGGFDPMEKTRRALGLDIFTVEVGNSTGNANSVASSATVSAGRYIGKRVYLGVKQGARADSSAVQLNYALTPHISAGTEAGIASGGAVSLNWKWDY